TSLIDVNLNNFLDERLQTCGSLDHCTVFIQQSSIRILRVYMKKGIKSASKLLDSYIDYLKKYSEAGRCSDNKCMKNAIKIFKSLNEIIDFSEQKTLKSKNVLFSRIKEYNLSEINEKKESNLLIPLSNETRIKILKILSKGGAYYSQLQRQVGLKGGHFYFHLDKLINAGYITHEEDKGLYLITINGLKALKFLFELSQELSI
ncbi:MAG: winged helix-turn-helix domain-containing protein, partial [Candidatus Hermodarchaeota archaeon]